MTIKKAFTAINDVLQANMHATVEDIYQELEVLMSAKSGGGNSSASNFHLDKDGQVDAIRCYYHKLWFDPRVVEFGKKASSPTGLNTMCKDGMSKWTKQQSEFKKAKEQLLEDVANGTVDSSEIAGILEELTEAKNRIISNDELAGYETLEDCLASQL